MGIVQLDENEVSLTLFANLYFYGNAANEMLAGSIAADINQHWTIPEGHARIRGKRYKVLFKTKGIFSPELTQEEVNENTNSVNNYFRIEEFASGNISFVDAINSNTGYFNHIGQRRN